MNGNPRTRFTMEDFGPIRSGEFELRPLTVFIGPNNTGKSYAATLAYMMARVLSRYSGIAENDDPLSTFVRTLIADEQSNRGISTSILDEHRFEQELDNLIDYVPTRLELGLQRYFSSRKSDVLSRVNATRVGGIDVSNSAGHSLIKIVLDADPRVTLGRSLLSRELIPHLRAVSPIPEGLADVVIPVLVEETWSAYLKSFGILFDASYYLPSARSGILAGWPLLASLAIDANRIQFGLQNVSIPPLAGTIGDFLQTILRVISSAASSQGSEQPLPLTPAIDILERSVLSGRIETSSVVTGSIDLEYLSGDVRLPVQRASAMVGEVAPLALVMQRLLRPNDLLVIDEPEAHLHPANQRHITRVLVRLATAGVTVVAPTHSSTIIHQLSNLVRASQLSDDECRELGLKEGDHISPDDVGVYAFHPTDNGSVIQEVIFDPEFGYPEDQFFEVAEDLSQETYRIDSKLEPVPA